MMTPQDALGQPEHEYTEECGFDRNASLNAGHYVCACGWTEAMTATPSELPGLPEEPPVIFTAGKWSYQGDATTPPSEHDSRELDAAAWHKLRSRLVEQGEEIAQLRREMSLIAVIVGRSKDGTGRDTDWFELADEVRQKIVSYEKEADRLTAQYLGMKQRAESALREAREKERERCAKFLDGRISGSPGSLQATLVDAEVIQCAKAIRSMTDEK
jgi:hypothetical protein